MNSHTAIVTPERGVELVRFTVPGTPYGAGSKTPRPKGRMEKDRFIPFTDKKGFPLVGLGHASKFTAPWMKTVTEYAKHAWPGSGAVGGALWLDAYFFVDRIGAHFFQRKSGWVLRPDAPAYPEVTETHDVDKMRRAISDSLTEAGLIVDDKRVVGGEQWKYYADFVKPCAVIAVGRMKHQTAEDAGLVTPAPTGQETLT